MTVEFLISLILLLGTFWEHLYLSSSNGTTVGLQKPLYMLIEKFMNGTTIVNV